MVYVTMLKWELNLWMEKCTLFAVQAEREMLLWWRTRLAFRIDIYLWVMQCIWDDNNILSRCYSNEILLQTFFLCWKQMCNISVSGRVRMLFIQQSFAVIKIEGILQFCPCFVQHHRWWPLLSFAMRLLLYHIHWPNSHQIRAVVILMKITIQF